MSRAPDISRLLPHPGSPPTTRVARLWVAMLLLAISLASFVHVAHAHEAQGTVASKHCPCWTAHDRVAPPSAPITLRLPCERPAAPDVQVAAAGHTDLTARPFQARAPPQLRA